MILFILSWPGVGLQAAGIQWFSPGFREMISSVRLEYGNNYFAMKSHPWGSLFKNVNICSEGWNGTYVPFHYEGSLTKPRCFFTGPLLCLPRAQ